MEKDIEIDGLKIHYEESGVPEGNPVILLHGWGCNHTTVRSIASCLSDKLRIVNIDLPGHGQSDEPKTVWGTFDFAHLIVKIIETLNLEKPSIIGHSFGGRTSIALASKFPLNKIVLVDSAGIKPRRTFKYYYKVYTFKIAKKIINLLYKKEKAKDIVEKMIHKKGSADYNSSTPVMRAVMSRCVNEDLRNIMGKIKSPTLLIWGDKDTATPLRDAKIMQKHIPDSGIVTFDGCGHYSFLDNPIGFKAVLREFFKDEMTNSRN